MNIHNVNPEFASSDSKNACTRTLNVFPPDMRLVLGRWPLQNCSISNMRGYVLILAVNIQVHCFRFIIVFEQKKCHSNHIKD